eukprot:5436585-Karenia_brevis.AAC.1
MMPANRGEPIKAIMKRCFNVAVHLIWITTPSQLATALSHEGVLAWTGKESFVMRTATMICKVIQDHNLHKRCCNRLLTMPAT